MVCIGRDQSQRFLKSAFYDGNSDLFVIVELERAYLSARASPIIFHERTPLRTDTKAPSVSIPSMNARRVTATPPNVRLSPFSERFPLTRCSRRNP